MGTPQAQVSQNHPMDWVLTAREQYPSWNLEYLERDRVTTASYIIETNASSQSEIESYVRQSAEVVLNSPLITKRPFVNRPSLFIGLSHLILLPFHIYHTVSGFYYRCHPSAATPAAHNIFLLVLFPAPIGLAVLLSRLIIINEQVPVLWALMCSLLSRAT